jgi:hypothetical protein
VVECKYEAPSSTLIDDLQVRSVPPVWQDEHRPSVARVAVLVFVVLQICFVGEIRLGSPGYVRVQAVVSYTQLAHGDSESRTTSTRR